MKWELGKSEKIQFWVLAVVGPCGCLTLHMPTWSASIKQWILHSCFFIPSLIFPQKNWPILNKEVSCHCWVIWKCCGQWLMQKRRHGKDDDGIIVIPMMLAYFSPSLGPALTCQSPEVNGLTLLSIFFLSCHSPLHFRSWPYLSCIVSRQHPRYSIYSSII